MKPKFVSEIRYINIIKLCIFTNLILQQHSVAGFILNIKICISFVQLHLFYTQTYEMQHECYMNKNNATWTNLKKNLGLLLQSFLQSQFKKNAKNWIDLQKYDIGYQWSWLNI